MRPVVTILVKGLGIGGAERLISEGARYWDSSAFDYRVVYFLPWKNQLVTELEGLGFPVTCVGTNRGMTARSVGRLRRQLRVWRADLVHAHSPWAGIAARLAWSGPVVYTEHNVVTSYRMPTRLVNRLTYGRNRAVTAVSPAVAATVAAYPGPEVVTIPNGVAVAVESAAARSVRVELGLEPSQPLVVHVGNIRPGKGHDLLVDMTRRLTQHRQDLTVVSVGGEKRPGDLARLQDRTRQAGLDGRLRFLGQRPDALSFIAAADVYVNPADFEGLPVAVLEAMALSRPVVATAVGGVLDLIKDGVNGVTVEPGSSEALAESVMSLLEDPAARIRLGASGAATVAADFSLERMVRAFEGIYRRLLE